MRSQVLVVAKAPVSGQVKTRLGAVIGMQQAAEIAAAALIDTLTACTEGFGPDRCHLALTGDLGAAVHGNLIADLLRDWSVVPQRGATFADRLAQAHADVAAVTPGPVLQIGMDTPQVTPALLRDAEAALGEPGAASCNEGVLGPTLDGGWWLLGLRDPRAARLLRGVVMSAPATFDDTRHALESTGLRIGTTTVLRDVDTVDDAVEVAADKPGGRFGTAWHTLNLGA